MSPETVASVLEVWRRAVLAGDLRRSTGARYTQVFESFCKYAQAQGATSLAGSSPELCRRFLHAPLRGGRKPCTATSRLRLTVLRSAFVVLLAAGAIDGDPTAGLAVRHAPAAFAPRPLTPPEASRLMLAGLTHPTDTLRPATSALALCGAAHAEIAEAVVADLELPQGLIRVGEGESARRVKLPEPLSAALSRRAEAQRRVWRRRQAPWEPELVPLALNREASSYPVNSVAPTVSGNLARALRHAGVTRTGVRPRSVREYAANVVYAETRRIEAVAERLGLSSLDSAARLIDSGWQQRWGKHVREGPADGG